MDSLRGKAHWLVLAAVLSLLVLSSVPAPLSVSTSAANEDRLALSPLPRNLPTNSSGVSTFSALVVSLDNAQGRPTVALNDTVVYLSSSETAVLTVQSSVTILAGSQYAIASVTTGETPGSSSVTAVSPGIESGSTQFNTYVPRGYPTQLEVYPLPPTFAANESATATYVVIVEDGAGLPARTVGNTPVQVTSSNLTVAQTGNAQIPVNETVAYGTLSTTGHWGTASITASASGLLSSSAIVSTLPLKGLLPGIPARLGISAPTALPADGGTYSVVTISLLDSANNPVVATSVIPIILTSSRTDLVSIQSTATVPAGQSYVTVPVKTTAGSGYAFITASALNFLSATTQIYTDNIPPTRLGIYLAENDSLVSTRANEVSLAVQLQDSQGIPAEARSAAHVIISFSNSTMNKPLLTLEIPKGQDLAYATIPLVGGTAGTFTAISNGLNSASANYKASDAPTIINLGAGSPTIRLNETTELFFSVLFQGIPLPGATVAWSTTGGAVTPTNSTTDSRGSATVRFSPTVPGVFTVTATVTDKAIGRVNGSTQIIVIQLPPRAPPPTLLSRIMGYIYYIIAAAAAAVVLVVVVVRRRRGRSGGEEEGFDLGGGPGAAFDLRGQ